MSIIKKASVAANEQDAQELVQPYSKPGFETCQDIQTIKEELARLEKQRNEAHLSGNVYYETQLNSRYWAIRWVMGWEKEIPNV